MTKRFEFLEGGAATPKKKASDIKPEKSGDEAICYPLLARYDFAGSGPRPGSDIDQHLFNQARGLVTRGEKLAPILLKLGMILLRIIAGLILFLVILRGHSFHCMGGGVSFR
jgi:hypothetical protein